MCSPEAINGNSPMASEAPQEVDVIVSDIWQKILVTTDLDAEGNFFLLGGDSMSAAMMIQLLWEETDLALTLADLYEHPGLGDLQAFVTRQLNKKMPG